jgi:uncharacterized damage-inducible protein DinB
MSFGDSFVPEFDHEMASTRRMIERVPSDKGQWKPHPKSFALGHLAQLLSWMPGWIGSAVREDNLDLEKSPKYSFETTDTLLKDFDANVNAAREALQSATDAQMDQMWTLSRGNHVFMKVPKRFIVRQHVSHLSHHRGQMSVYLRLLDVPLPMVYGPTADERMP